MRVMALIIYLGVGAACYAVFQGAQFDWTSAWTVGWLLGWPFLLIVKGLWVLLWAFIATIALCVMLMVLDRMGWL